MKSGSSFFVLYRYQALTSKLLRKSYFLDVKEALAAMRHSVERDSGCPTDYMLFGPGGRYIATSDWRKHGVQSER